MPVDAGAVARVVGIDVNFVDLRGNNITFLPQRVVLPAQGRSDVVYGTDKIEFTSAKQVGDLVGFGSPAYLAALELYPVNGDGLGTIASTLYPLAEAGGATAATGDITPVLGGGQLTNTQAIIRIGGVDSQPFSILTTDTVATLTAKMTTAISAVLAMPVTATDNTIDVGIVTTWKAASANKVTIQVIGINIDITFAITQPVGGTLNPDVDDALVQVGNVWETCIINPNDLSDTTTLDKFSTFGEGRWQTLVKQPLTGCFVGNTEVDQNTATTVSEGRKADRINSMINVPGSDELPITIAARAVARIAVQANNNPPVDYVKKGLLTGIDTGTEAEQWDYLTRDAAVKRGGSTSLLVNSVAELQDVVTFYHPDGEVPPAFSKVVTIVKLQQIVFNINLIFEGDNWKGNPLLNDDDPTTNEEARKPKDARSAVSEVLQGAGLNAIIVRVAEAIANTTAEIDSQNPNRLNIKIPITLSGNTDIISIVIDFGFNFTDAALV